ncbi:hypothetical protein ABIB25_002021 [Nakamurella sp. UYEF19]|uniref:hypothetical protein n=1 Tax=Nakamurella sp. UYEF19 TaxID=1756392 RepID=UPI003399EDC7
MTNPELLTQVPATAGAAAANGTTADANAADAPIRGDVVAVVASLVLVATASAVGYLLLANGVEINLQSPPLFARFVPHVGIGTPFALCLGLLGFRFAPRLAEHLPWHGSVPLAAVTAMAWTTSLALVDGWQAGWVGRLTVSNEYLYDLPRIGSVGPFLSGFTSHILDFQPGSWTTHVSSHPPGATLVFLLLDRIGLGGGGWAGALVVLVGSTAGVAVCLTIRTLGAPVAARRLLPFAVFFPGAVWVGVSADGLFAGVAAWGIALAVLGARRGGRSGALVGLAGGLLLGYTAYLSYGLVLLVLVLAVAVMFSRRRRIHLAVLAGVIAVVTIFTLAGFDWLEGERLLVLRYYQGVASLRPYSYYVWANLAALTLSVGPMTAAGLRRAVPVVLRSGPVIRASGIVDRETLVPAALSLAAGLAVLIADLTGLSKAETERIWLPLGFWMIASLVLLPRRLLPAALAVQIAVAIGINHLEMTYW